MNIEQIAQETASRIQRRAIDEEDVISDNELHGIIFATLREQAQAHEKELAASLVSIHQLEDSRDSFQRVGMEMLSKLNQLEKAHESQVSALITERDSVTRLLEDAREERRQVLAAIQKLMGSGAGMEEVVQVIDDRIAAEAVLDDGEYEAADGMEDVVRWMKQELATAREDVKRLTKTLEQHGISVTN